MDKAYMVNCFSSTPEPNYLFLSIRFRMNGVDIELNYAQFTGTWNFNGRTYEFLPFELTNVAMNSYGEKNRPILNIVNPEGQFTKYVRDGVLEGAVVEIYSVPKSKYEGNIPVYRKMSFIAYHVKGFNKESIAIELRNGTDAPRALFPPRTFYPPNFGVVTL